MDVIIELFNKYSVESIIIFILAFGVGLKFVGELYEFFYNKLRKHFNYQNSKDIQHNEMMEEISKIGTNVSNLSAEILELQNRISFLEEKNDKIVARLQNNIRSYIIDKHHYFCYRIKAIDELNMENLERDYLYYKNNGGDSFIGGLMEEIRSLPRIIPENYPSEKL